MHVNQKNSGGLVLCCGCVTDSSPAKNLQMCNINLKAVKLYYNIQDDMDVNTLESEQYPESHQQQKCFCYGMHQEFYLACYSSCSSYYGIDLMFVLAGSVLMQKNDMSHNGILYDREKANSISA